MRYNIVQNNSRHGFNLHADPRATSEVYNNIVFTNIPSSSLANSSGGATSLNKATYVFRNNIFFAATKGPAIAKGTNSSFDNNLYFGTSVASGDGRARTSDPLLTNPGTGGIGSKSGWALATLGGYKLKAGSPCLNAGLPISGNGGSDFWGGVLPPMGSDIGVHEFGATTSVSEPRAVGRGSLLADKRGILRYGPDGRRSHRNGPADLTLQPTYHLPVPSGDTRAPETVSSP